MALWDYIKAAFNARPIGMFFPPNWAMVGGFALAGFVHPGFWLIGAGAELGYLVLLSTNRRFQRFVDGTKMCAGAAEKQLESGQLLAQLPVDDRTAFQNLQFRCQSILREQQRSITPAELQTQSDGLGRLLNIYLRLLLTRRTITQALYEREDNDRDPIASRIDRLSRQLERTDLSDDLRKSYQGQLAILQQRQQQRGEAEENLAFTEAELTRIREQVELIREQAALSSDPGALSGRIDQIGQELGATNQWIRERQQLYGQIGDDSEQSLLPPIPER